MKLLDEVNAESLKRISEQTSPRPGKCFCLGDVWITPGVNEIGDVRVEAKAMDVLIALVDAAPHVLSVSDLLDRVWPDVVVVENVVYQAVAQLRKALSDDARAPRYIEHVSKRGYRLIAAITCDAHAPTARVGMSLPWHASIMFGNIYRFSSARRLWRTAHACGEAARRTRARPLGDECASVPSVSSNFRRAACP